MKAILLVLLIFPCVCLAETNRFHVEVPGFGAVTFPVGMSPKAVEQALSDYVGFSVDGNFKVSVVALTKAKPRRDIFDEVGEAKTKPAPPLESPLRLKGVAPPEPVIGRTTQPDPLGLWAGCTLLGTALVFAVWAALRRLKPLAADTTLSLSVWFPRWWADTRVSLGFVVGAALLLGWVVPRLYEPSFVSITPDTSRVIYHHRRQWLGPTITTRLEARQERESRTFQWMAQGTKSGDWYVFFRDVD
jgi:hypothetical protein